MHASTIFGAAVALYSASVAALPAGDNDQALEKRADPTAVWVSVDDEGRPGETVTPTPTTIDGEPTILNGAPHDLTATVFTHTSLGRVWTTTEANPPNPSATNKNKQGAFGRCSNMDGEHKPLCDPASNSTLYVGTTYYVTWDPEFYNISSTRTNASLEISVRLDYLNRTSEHSDEGEYLKLDELSRVPASWGVYPLDIKKNYLRSHYPHNGTITLMTSWYGSDEKSENVTIPVVFDKHRSSGPEKSAGPADRDLLIALPITFGGLAFIMFGLFLWNRKTRRIQLGNVMSRSRHGYTGRKARRVFRKDNDIHLSAQPVSPGAEYRDNDDLAAPARPRRDSDGLEDLVNSPVHSGFSQQGGNGFRDELRRQEQQRRQERRLS